MKLERSLVELTSLQQAILNGANCTIISTDLDGTVRTWNKTAEEWLGYTAAEVIGHSTPAIIHDPAEVADRAAALSKELGDVVPAGFEVFVIKPRLQGSPDENEWTYIRKDGSRFPVLLSVTTLLDAAGNVSG